MENKKGTKLTVNYSAKLDRNYGKEILEENISNKNN